MMIDIYAYRVMKELREKGKARFGNLLTAVSNPRTLNRKLKMLNSFGLVRVDNKLYLLTERGLRIESLLSEINKALRTKVEIRVERIPHGFFGPVLRKYCEILYDHFGKRLKGVLVFGSVARGDWDKNSDIDLLVVVSSLNKPIWERTRELLALRNELRKTSEYERAVEGGFYPVIQHYPLDEIEAQRFHRLYLDACIDGIILYEKDSFLTEILNKFRFKLAEMGAKRITVPGKRHYWILREIRAGEVFEI